MTTVDEACLLLADYNGRLTAELEERKHMAKMLFDYIVAQKESLNVAQNRLKVWWNYTVIYHWGWLTCLRDCGFSVLDVFPLFLM